MNLTQIKEAVRAGITAMKKEPAAFLCIDSEDNDWTWDSDSIFDKPVYHSSDVRYLTQDMFIIDCPFIPLSTRDGEITWRDIKAFMEGFESALLKQQ